MNRFFWVFLGFFALLSAPVQAFEPFVVNQVLFDGLERIEADNLDQYLVIRPGKALTAVETSEQIRVLYGTGFFNDVHLKRSGNNVILQVQERKMISEVTVEGNKAVKTDNIMDAFESMELKQGAFYDRLRLKQMDRELHTLYSSHSKYNAKVEIEEKEEKAGQISIHVNISEGKSSKIRDINIVGNQVFDEKILLDKMNLSAGRMLSFFSKDNEFSRQKLSADLEMLRSYYMDRGYADFSVESVQVSIGTDRKDIFITINIHEGGQYTVGDIGFQANDGFSREDFEDVLSVEKGQVFSRQKIIESSGKMRESFGKKGFLLADVNAFPVLEKETNVVNIMFEVDSGKKVYVRKINFIGNNKTRDDVLRREMRQMEGAEIATDKVKRSRIRLQRLNYFKNVSVDTVPVSAVNDQVDLDFRVQEKPSGSFIGGLGFSQAQGLLINASVQQKNFLGTGDTIGLNINNSDVNTVYSANYTNPYYTMDGVSRGFRLFSRKTDAGAAKVADFSADNYGGSIRFGIPVSEFSTANISFGLEHQTLNDTATTPQEFVDFINDNTDDFDLFRVSGGISHDTRNRVVFAEHGVLASASGDVTLPGSGLTFYKVSLSGQWRETFWKPFTMVLKSNISYGSSYGETTELPFFERFFAGGTQSIRGFRSNSLGPRTAVNDSPMGGAFKVIGNAEIIFPPPFSEDNDTVRLALFVDIGNVYDSIDTFDVGELRYTTGISIVWLSPLGPLSFSLASALNDREADDVEGFQFSLGTLF